MSAEESNEAHLDALAAEIGQIEAGKSALLTMRRDNEVTPLDKSSRILNRIKLWPPQHVSASSSLDAKSRVTTKLETAKESMEDDWDQNLFPFRAEEFGQLKLAENVIMAKLVSLNSYGASVPAPLLKGRHQPTES